MLDTRREIYRIWNRLELKWDKAIIITLICLALAAGIALLPTYEGLSPAGRWMFFILLLAAGLWITEAMPAFAVAFLVVGLEIYILGKPGGVMAKAGDYKLWEMFLRPWGQSTLWLFVAGFILAQACSKTNLDSWIARKVIGVLGDRPGAVLFGVIAITFVFSMFMSNTACTAMMFTVVTPLLLALGPGHPFQKALALAVPFAANIGGMGTIIGTPPNAIAAGALKKLEMEISFGTWMKAGMPPALILAAITWVYLMWRFPCKQRLDTSALTGPGGKTKKDKDGNALVEPPGWQKLVVAGTFTVTILLWLTESLHDIPTTVVSFIPICVFALLGILNAHDVRKLEWDVLVLVAGGLALGDGVKESGLASWLVTVLPGQGAGPIVVILVMTVFACLMSQFMSNTAAANIMIPLTIGVAAGFEQAASVSIALAVSAAMCLPISTPPNAIAYASGHLKMKDMVEGGLVIGLIAPFLAVFWCRFIFS